MRITQLATNNCIDANRKNKLNLHFLLFLNLDTEFVHDVMYVVNFTFKPIYLSSSAPYSMVLMIEI